MKRRELDGCPITGALQMLGDKWTMLVVQRVAGWSKANDGVAEQSFSDQQSHARRTLARHGEGSTWLSAQTSAAILRTLNMR